MARAPLNRNGDHLHADISDDRRSPRQRVDDAVETGRFRRKCHWFDAHGRTGWPIYNIGENLPFTWIWEFYHPSTVAAH